MVHVKKISVTWAPFLWPVKDYAIGQGYQSGPNPRLNPPPIELEPVLYQTHDPRSKPYAPLDERPWLFRVFADLGDSDSDILSFANQYGSLGEPLWYNVNGTRYMAERLAKWRAEIQEMCRVVSWWDELRQGDASVAGHPFTGPGDTEAAPSPMALMQDRLQKMNEITSVINAKLLKGVSFQLLADPHADRMTLSAVPTSLLAVLWLELALEIGGDRKFKRCLSCQKYFESSAMTPGRGRAVRSDKQFCSETCRTSHHRELRADANVAAMEKPEAKGAKDNRGSRKSKQPSQSGANKRRSRNG